MCYAIFVSKLKTETVEMSDERINNMQLWEWEYGEY